MKVTKDLVNINCLVIITDGKYLHPDTHVAYDNPVMKV